MGRGQARSGLEEPSTRLSGGGFPDRAKFGFAQADPRRKAPLDLMPARVLASTTDLSDRGIDQPPIRFPIRLAALRSVSVVSLDDVRALLGKHSLGLTGVDAQLAED